MKKKICENFLDNIPKRNNSLKWSFNNENIVTLEVQNTGFFNKLAQKFFKRPPITYVHLDEFGSFVWSKIDGKKTIFELAAEVEEKFGERVQPLYDRLIQFLKILESYNFVIL